MSFYSLFYCIGGESNMIYTSGFALQLLAAIRKDVDKKMHFAMKSLTGWKRNGDKYGRNKPQLHLEELDVSLRVRDRKLEV